MSGFLKVFARGIIVTLLLPVILLIWLLYTAYCLVSFFITFCINLVLFFMGYTFDNELKEDKEAKRMLLENEKQKSDMTQMMGQVFQNVLNQMQTQNTMQQANQNIEENKNDDNSY